MNYEQHVQQNNERLICIKQALQDQSTFVAAAKELLEWCLDPRAFQKPFEDNIIDCLNVVNRVARRDGYDLNLSCRLLSICANYRDKFSTHYAGAIEKWNEELSQTVLLLHQPATFVSTQTTPTSNSTTSSMDGSKMMQKNSNMMGTPQQEMIWSNGPGGAVSVVTTVYSGVPAFNNAAQQSYSAASSNVYNGSMAGSVGYSGVPNATAMQKTPVYGVDNPYGSYSQSYHSTAADYSNSAPQAAALNAAQVAAAAVATATATATAVALDQSQFQSYHGAPQNGYAPQYGGAVGMVQNQYQNQRLVPPNSIGRPQMPPNYGAPASRSRASVPAGYNTTAGKMMPSVGTPGGVPMTTVQYSVQPSMNTRGIGSQVSYPPQMVPINSNAVHGTYRQRLPANQVPVRSPQYGMVSQTPYANISYPGNLSQTPMPGHVMSAASYQTRMYSSAAGNPMNSVSATCHGNPTPPMTPVNVGGMISPPGYPNVMAPSNNVPSVMDVKPAVNCQVPIDDDRLTTPVTNGIIMMPFRLEHNSPVTQHIYVLNEQSWHFLLSSPDNDLQLKCFHQEDKMMACHWPANASVQISVNGTPVLLADNEKPLYIKSLCQPNKNVLQISVQQCSCSHLFILSLVQRPEISMITKNLLNRKRLSQEQAIEKIKRFFNAGENSLRSIDGQIPDIEQMSINMSIRCPISMQKIQVPARGQLCRHHQCFDVETFLRMNKDRAKWCCPVCKIELHLDSLEIDQYIWGIITNLQKTDVDEVSIDAAAMWKAVIRNGPDEGGTEPRVKEEISGGCSNPKRIKTEHSSSSQMGSSWSMVSSFGGPPTPNAVAGANLASPSYCQTNSPLNPGLHRQRSSNSAAPLTPLSSVNTCTPSGYPLTPRQSMGPPTPQQGCGNIKMGPLTPVTPFNNYNPPSVGQPRSVGNPPSVEPIPNLSTPQQQLANQITPSQIDVSFASSSAPYTPASVGSTGSQYGGTGNNVVPTDVYNQDVLSDLELFLTDTTTTDSGGLFADSMDPLELLKYLDNGDNNNDGSTNATSSYSYSNRAVTNAGGGPSTSDHTTQNKQDFSNVNNRSHSKLTNQHSSTSSTADAFKDLDEVLSFLN